jgi:hypothetical protein
MLLGMVRESNILPATNQPIVDLLLAFGPFTLAALCLLRAALVPGGRYVIGPEQDSAGSDGMVAVPTFPE